MRSKKESKAIASASGDQANQLRLAVVSENLEAPPSRQDAAQNATHEWDPYQVWRRHIRPDSDAA